MYVISHWYIHAILARCLNPDDVWIVGLPWVAQSLRRGRLLREEEFEAASCDKAVLSEAPRRARLEKVSCDNNYVFC